MKYKKGDSLENWSFTVIQENMNLWADILDDPNPIHLDVKFCEITRFRRKNY
jgi:acyl dehydratase